MQLCGSVCEPELVYNADRWRISEANLDVQKLDKENQVLFAWFGVWSKSKQVFYVSGGESEGKNKKID